jgi:hypothetical protein
MTVTLIKTNHDAAHTSYTFDLTADSYYPTPTSEYTDSPTDIMTITVHLELEPDRDFESDIRCESDCDIITGPYFWLHEYFGLHACLSHISESAQTEILAQINATL